MDVLERIERGELSVGNRYDGCDAMAEAELLRLAKIGQAVLDQQEELEHLAQTHGIYAVKSILSVINGEVGHGGC